MNNLEYKEQSISEIQVLLPEGTIIRDITFPSKDDALTYFEDINKIYPSVATKYLKPLGDFNSSSIFVDLNEKLLQSIENYTCFPENMLKKLSEQKSNLKGCSNCKSSINKDFHIKNVDISLERIIKKIETQEINVLDTIYNMKSEILNCPICDDISFIITETDITKLKSLKNKIKENEKKLKEAKIEFSIKTGNEPVWIHSFSE